ncbi:hypothetical protein V8G54_016928 [Vigna mungo]|uniref:Uncharacterized protein n=1 Tax=Vigna mungo TaxID=3915 RepID=A0AAQ3NQ19_VIGMU
MVSFVGPTHGDERIGDFEAFLRAITSGVVVVASTLGFWYCSSLSSSGANSLQSFSDFANQDQLQQKRQNKPPRQARIQESDGLDAITKQTRGQSQRWTTSSRQYFCRKWGSLGVFFRQKWKFMLTT